MSEPLPTFPSDLDVAIVSHNGRATLARVLDALDRASVPRERITVYDIASTDGTSEWILAECSPARVVRLDDNRGPNPARNVALSTTRQPFLLLLDSDAYVEVDTIQALRAATGPDVGMVVPVVVHDREPTRIQYAGGALHFICEATSPWQNVPLVARGRERLDIGSAPGLCCLVDVTAARRVGLFDERFFMGKEDGEFCYRLRLAGLRIVENPSAVVRHESRPRSNWLYRYQIRNRWYFILKNYEGPTLLALVPVSFVHEPLQFALLASRGAAGAWFSAARGLVSWLPSLGKDRRAVAAIRRVHDRDMLVATPLVVRDDVTGQGIGASFKRAYDAWLAAYWTAVQWILPGRSRRP